MADSAKRRGIDIFAVGWMLSIDKPFVCITVDLISPIALVSKHGNRYILTVIDFATRYQ